MDDKVKELEERLRNRVRYNVGMDTAAPKNNNDYCEKDYCENMNKCKHSKHTCDSDNPDCHVKAYSVPMTYEDFMQVVSDIFGMPFDGSYIRRPKHAYMSILNAINNAQELEKYINKKDEFCKAASNKFREIEKKFNENKLTKKDFSTDKFKTTSWEEREKKEKELIERLKVNMNNAKTLMNRVGDRKQAEYVPAGKVENIEKETIIDSNVIKGAKAYMANPNCIPTENKTASAKIFDEILETMRKTYYAKNTDYGSSFDKGIDRYGWTSFKTRIFDKFNRVETILDNKESDPDYKPLVQDEKLEDTLLDMANYAILAIIYLRTH